jgi:hypothetical protein
LHKNDKQTGLIADQTPLPRDGPQKVAGIERLPYMNDCLAPPISKPDSCKKNHPANQRRRVRI